VYRMGYALTKCLALQHIRPHCATGRKSTEMYLDLNDCQGIGFLLLQERYIATAANVLGC